MFSFYQNHSNLLYIKLVDLSRNIFFHKEIGLKDNFETRINLIFIHFSLLLIIFKKLKKDFPQDIFDNIFQNIEYHIRELGYGDVAVNKKMKTLLHIFYDILLKVRENSGEKNLINKKILSNYLEPQNKMKSSQLINDLANYFQKYYYFCFELENNSVLKGQINFKY